MGQGVLNFPSSNPRMEALVAKFGPVRLVGLVLILIGLTLLPVVGILAVLTSVVGASLYIFYPQLQAKARELKLLSHMRHVALLFSANLVAVKSFERALEKTLSALEDGEIRQALRKFLVEGSLKGQWASFFSFVRDHVKGGKEESINRALSYYLKALEETFKKALDNTINPIKLFLALAILLPIMVMVAIPIFSLLSHTQVEIPIAYFFAFLLPLSYGAFILYIYYTKPRLSISIVEGSFLPIIGLVIGAIAALFLPSNLVPFTISILPFMAIVFHKEKVKVARPWQALHPLMAKLSLYLQEGYSFEYAMAKAGENPFATPHPLIQVVKESSKRSVFEAGKVAEKLADMLERAEEMEESFRKKLDEVLSTLSIVESFVLPVVGGATLAFLLAFFEYIQQYGDLLPFPTNIEVKPIVWSFSLYVVESLLILSILQALLEGKEGLSWKQAKLGLALFPASFAVLYIFIQALMGIL